MNDNKLLKEIEFLVATGHSITFSRVVNQFEITVRHERSGKELSQMIPMDDHVYEDKVLDCIKFIKDKISPVWKKRPS